MAFWFKRFVNERLTTKLTGARPLALAGEKIARAVRLNALLGRKMGITIATAIATCERHRPNAANKRP